MLAHELLGDGAAVDERRVSLSFQIEHAESQGGGHQANVHVQTLEETLVGLRPERHPVGGCAEHLAGDTRHAQMLECSGDFGSAMLAADLHVFELPGHQVRQLVEGRSEFGRETGRTCRSRHGRSRRRFAVCVNRFEVGSAVRRTTNAATASGSPPTTQYRRSRSRHLRCSAAGRALLLTWFSGRPRRIRPAPPRPWLS